MRLLRKRGLSICAWWPFLLLVSVAAVVAFLSDSGAKMVGAADDPLPGVPYAVLLTNSLPSVDANQNGDLLDATDQPVASGYTFNAWSAAMVTNSTVVSVEFPVGTDLSSASRNPFNYEIYDPADRRFEAASKVEIDPVLRLASITPGNLSTEIPPGQNIAVKIKESASIWNAKSPGSSFVLGVSTSAGRAVAQSASYAIEPQVSPDAETRDVPGRHTFGFVPSYIVAALNEGIVAPTNGFAGSLTPDLPNQQRPPVIAVSTSEVVPNQTIAIQGQGFTAGDNTLICEKEIRFEGAPVQLDPQRASGSGAPCLPKEPYIRVNRDGSFVAWAIIPITAETLVGGKVYQLVVSDNFESRATTELTMLKRSLSVSPAISAPNSNVTIAGIGFPVSNTSSNYSPGISVTYRCSSGCSRVTTATPDTTGAFRVTLPVPSDAPVPSTGTIEAALTGVPGLEDTLLSSGQHQIPPATVKLDSSSGPAGTRVQLTGQNFPRFTPVDTLTLGGIDLTPAPKPNTDVNGGIQFGFLVPGLNPGTYSVTLRVGNAAGSDTFTVTQTPILGPVSPSRLDFQGRNPPGQTISVRNSGGGSMGWGVSKSQGWLTLSPLSGSSSGETDSVTVGVNTAGLTDGTYRDTVTVSAPGATNSPQTVAVTLDLAQGPRLTVKADIITPQINVINPVGAGGELAIQNTGGGDMDWEVSHNESWLILSSDSGSSSGEVDLVKVEMNAEGLPEGTYTDTITVSAPGAPNPTQTITITLQVVPPPSDPTPILSVTPAGLDYRSSTGGPNPGAQSLTIQNVGDGDMGWTVSESVPWLTLSPLRGSSSGEADRVTVGVNTENLAVGTHSTTIMVTAAGADNRPQAVTVTLTLTQRPILSVSSGLLPFEGTAAGGGGGPGGQPLTIQNTGSGTLDWTASGNAPWLSVSAVRGSLSARQSAEVMVTVNNETLAVGAHSATITVTAPGADNSPQSVTVTINTPAPPPDPVVTLDVTPPTISMAVTEGESNLERRLLTIGDSGGGLVNWQVRDDAPWLTLIPSSGTFSGEPVQVTLAVDVTALEEGTHHATVTITTPDTSGSVRTVPVEVFIEGRPIGWQVIVDNWEMVVTIIGGASVVVGGLSVRYQRTMKLRRRENWQRNATEEHQEESDQPCQQGTWQCTREVDADPALRKVIHVTLITRHTPSGEKAEQREVKGQIVEDLNRGVVAVRLGQRPEHSDVTAIAELLSMEIIDHLHSTDGPRAVELSAHMEGSEATATFTLRRCEAGSWKEVDKWELKLKDEVDDGIGALPVLDPSDPGLAGQVSPILSPMLITFLARA